jgi:hypothetical protein
MDLQDIKTMVKEYAIVLTEEYAAKADAERLRIATLASATIDGKNERKRQAGEALNGSEPYQKALLIVASTEIERRIFDAEIGLTKAWLYSQSGH